MRVGVVCHFPPPPGGMPGQAARLVDGLCAEGINAFRIPINLGVGRLAQKLDGTRFVRSLLRAPVFLARLIAGTVRADVLHVMATGGLYFYLFSGPAILVGRMFGRRVILNFKGGNGREFFRAHRWLVRPVIALAHSVIVGSGFLVSIFQEELGITASVVPNICDAECFSRDDSRPVAPVFIVARHLEPLYNVACVIRAFGEIRRSYPDAVLHVLGGGTEAARLRHLVKGSGLDSSVIFHGYVDHDRIPELFREASIFLNGSNIDNTPNAILEAFASGLPVVTTRAGGIPHLVEHGRTGLLVPLDDHAAMAREALRLLGEPGLAANLARNGREVVRRSSWPNVFRLLQATYSQLPLPAVAAETSRKMI